MRSVAIYSLKGGVGKTSLSLNLAWAAATLSARRTLLWDLDAQAAATFLAGARPRSGAGEAQGLFAREIAPDKLVVPTQTARLDLLPADRSLRSLDRFFFTLGKKKRLEKLLQMLAHGYDRVLLDCPPGLSETSEQVLRAADLIVVPVIPSPLSRRALDEVVAHLGRSSGRRGAILPVFNMVDRRRAMHRSAIEAAPDWPVIPMASAVEAMAVHHDAVGSFAPGAPAADAVARLWRAVERRLIAAESS
ncbi:ParA family protein [Sphingosinicella sp. BN140058]|uniref:ParA family protein n=1 Tax=Sphingosinicella sp. BN140058 TaxID=1892855 RepID=UPI0010116191|nr:ParA family protein [Sphingosinicella sp. BN140058]QAY78304.1 ParA family protein [Sphingosinicella sp. BN140058]